MLSIVNSATVSGVKINPVKIETAVYRGIPGLNIIGMGDVAIKEAGERIKSAITNSGFKFPQGKVTINLSPAWKKKRGSITDLAMAIGVLSASGQLRLSDSEHWCFAGEVSLDGKINKVNGILPMLIHMKERGIKRFIIPAENMREAKFVSGIDVYIAEYLKEVECIILNRNDSYKLKQDRAISGKGFTGLSKEKEYPDFFDVKGQEVAKRGITIAVAGGHNIILTGSPGTGKSMLAERIPGIMPELTYDEKMEITGIYSAAGKLASEAGMINVRPFREVGPGITAVGLVGGGISPAPGEVTLAHKSVLFIDEIRELDRKVIDVLRIPMEKKEVKIIRGGEEFVFPSDFILVAASNPCKCGYYGDQERECKCSASEVNRYYNKLSGPIADRIDIHIRLNRVKYEELKSIESTTSSEMRKLVEEGRKVQIKRYRNEKIEFNAQLTPDLVEKYCIIKKDADDLLKSAYKKYEMNPRTIVKTKKIARTIADIRGSDLIEIGDVAEAIRYRRTSI